VLTQGDPLPPGLTQFGGSLNFCFRVLRYGTEFPGFNGKDLTGGDPLEQYPITIADEDINIEPDVLINKNKGNITAEILGGADLEIVEETIWLENSPLVNSYTRDGNLFLEFDNMEIFETMDEYYKRYDDIKLHLTGYIDGEDGGWFIGSDQMVYNPGSKDNLTKSIAQTTPEKFALQQNYPNPFNPETEIGFQLPEANSVNIKIFNLLGQEVRAFNDMVYEAGAHIIRWDGRNDSGYPVSSGIYIYKIQAGDFSQAKKMILER
jgi:hypothetical protein